MGEEVGQQHGVVPAGHRIGADLELVSGVGGEALAASHVNRVRVQVDPDPIAVEMMQVAPDPTSDVEHTTFDHPPDVTSVWGLRSEQPLPASV